MSLSEFVSSISDELPNENMSYTFFDTDDDFNVDDDGLEVILSGVDKDNNEIEIPNYVDYNTYKVNERNTYLLFKLKESLFIDFDWCIEQRKKNKKRIERKMRKYY